MKPTARSPLRSRCRQALAAVLAVLCLASTKGRAAATQPADGLFEVYQANRREGIGNYVTEDFLLLATGMVISRTLTQLEENLCLPTMKRLVDGLCAKLNASATASPGTRYLADYLAVLDTLLNGGPPTVKPAHPRRVAAELERIKNAQGIGYSDLMFQKIDYGSFKVRGKYTRSVQLGRYFQAMQYAGAVWFPLLASAATRIDDVSADRLTALALELAQRVYSDAELKKAYNTLENAFNTLFGPPEDLTLADYRRSLERSGRATPAEHRRYLYRRTVTTGRLPRIHSCPIDLSRLEKGRTAAQVLAGGRFLPKRFASDSAAFQQLTFDRVTTYLGRKRPFSLTFINGRPVKGFPLGLELMALLGSGEACERLEYREETFYQGYHEAVKTAAEIIVRGAGLSARALAVAQYWLRPGGGGEQPGDVRRLNSCLAFWTYQRYLGILYIKPTMAPAFKSMDLNPPRPAAWIEPAPELYRRLQSLVAPLAEMVDDKGAALFVELLGRCRRIAATEQKGVSLPKDDIAFLNSLDGELLLLTGGKDHPVVVDVHTDPNSRMVLEEALGRPHIITKTIAGRKLRGALLSYCEFKMDMSERLNDSTWRAMLADPVQMKGLQLSPGSTAMLAAGCMDGGSKGFED